MEREERRLDSGPVDLVADEEPGTEAITAARESSHTRAGRLARSTAFFSFATSLSRITASIAGCTCSSAIPICRPLPLR